MVRILGISGSLRAGSFNTALLRAAQPLAAADMALEIATLHGIPVYDGDLESHEGIPRTVQDLKARILACDGLLIATPEYNNAMPGVLKNGIDWLSRPAADIPRIFGGRPVALIGASPGGFGTILSQNSWLPVFRYLSVQLWSGGRLMVSHAGQAFDSQGALADEAARKQLADFLRGFASFVQSARVSR